MILTTISCYEPVGRRVLANNVGLGERIVRTEVDFLKNQNLIDISSLGMILTPEGEEVMNELKEFIHEVKGLTEVEEFIRKKLNLKKIIVVPGNIEQNNTIVKDMGSVASNYIKSILKSNSIIALTGGRTVKGVVDSMPKLNNFKDILVVPARGGIGKNVEIQANTLAAGLANKLNGAYKLLHVPDNLRNKDLYNMLDEKYIKEINEILENIKNADIIIYGIGKAYDMALRRGLSKEKINNLEKVEAVGEAFGCYFNKNGELVYSTPTIGINNMDITNIENPIAVAAGREKAEAIIAIERGNSKGTLIIDESAALEIIRILKK
jgi:central glycolytic genes regulator